MKKKVICVGLVAIFVISAFVNIKVSADKISISNDGDDGLDQYNTIQDVILIDPGRGEYSFAQSFKPTYNILTRAVIKRNNMGSGNPTHVKLTIRSDLNGNNIAKPILVKPVDIWDVWLDFDFPDLQVTPEETYYLVWTTIGGAWGYLGSNTDPYSRGNLYSFNMWVINDKWEENKKHDICFKTYGRNGDDGNNAPEKPVLIKGLEEGKIGVEYTFQFESKDIDGNKVKYRIKSSDKSIYYDSDLFNHTETADVNLVWENPAVYWLEVVTVDEHGSESSNSLELDPIYISDYQNTAPMKPELTGEDFGDYYKNYEYTAVTWDCDKNQIWYSFDWGDETISDWLGPYNSGDTCKPSHKWKGNAPREFNVKVKAKDGYGSESEWSELLSVTMPRNKQSVNKPILQFLENHPLICQLLQQLLKL